MARQALVLPPVVVLLIGLATPVSGPADAPRHPGAVRLPLGTWTWPVTGPVIRGFDPPDTPYGAGHRGIDIAVGVGTPILAPAAGVVSFSGSVGGGLFITIDHGDQLSSTSSWIDSSIVRGGDAVARGQPIGTTGTGHPGSTVPHLHFGVKLDGAYVDPLELFGPLGVQDLIRLVPLAA